MGWSFNLFCVHFISYPHWACTSYPRSNQSYFWPVVLNFRLIVLIHGQSRRLTVLQQLFVKRRGWGVTQTAYTGRKKVFFFFKRSGLRKEVFFRTHSTSAPKARKRKSAPAKEYSSTHSYMERTTSAHSRRRHPKARTRKSASTKLYSPPDKNKLGNDE